MSQVFGEIEKSENTKVVIAINEYNKSKYLDIRQWWKPKDSNDYTPTKSGVTIPLEEIDNFIKAVQQANEAA